MAHNLFSGIIYHLEIICGKEGNNYMFHQSISFAFMYKYLKCITIYLRRVLCIQSTPRKLLLLPKFLSLYTIAEISCMFHHIVMLPQISR